MATDPEYRAFVGALRSRGIQDLWLEVMAGVDRLGPTWSPVNWRGGRCDVGKVFECLVPRALEVAIEDEARSGTHSLGSNAVTWPYSVRAGALVGSLGQGGSGAALEQIDGPLHLDGTSHLIEAKSGMTESVNYVPLAKLQSQIRRRPAGTMGMVFALKGFSEPAKVLANVSSPQCLMLWERDEIASALTKGGMLDGVRCKRRYAVEYGTADFVVTGSRPREW